MITAAKLIRDSLIFAGVIDQDEIEIDQYAANGLNFLNRILSQWGALSIYIPYPTFITIPLVPDVYEYAVTPVITQIMEGNITFSNNPSVLLTNINIATDKDDNLSNYQITKNIPRSVYLSPEQYFADPINQILGSKIRVFPTPNDNFTLNMLVKYELGKVSLTQELTGYPDWFIKPLSYQLTKDLSLFYRTKMSPEFEIEHERLMVELKAANPIDMSINLLNPFKVIRPFRPWGYYVR